MTSFIKVNTEEWRYMEIDVCVCICVYIQDIHIYIYIYWSYTYICICVYIVSFRAGGDVVSFIFFFLNSSMFLFLCPPKALT